MANKYLSDLQLGHAHILEMAKRGERFADVEEMNRYENYIPADMDLNSYYNNPVEVAAREYAEEWVPKYVQYIDSI